MIVPGGSISLDGTRWISSRAGFLLHVLPRGFHRILHYGVLAASSPKTSAARAREFFAVAPPPPAAEPAEARTCQAPPQGWRGAPARASMKRQLDAAARPNACPRETNFGRCGIVRGDFMRVIRWVQR
jgi:hypothetical protein